MRSDDLEALTAFREKLEERLRALYTVHDGPGKNGYGSEVVAPFLSGAREALLLLAEEMMEGEPEMGIDSEYARIRADVAAGLRARAEELR